ncbi:hypothetical protein ACI65C_011456 [Semiaphis heraclei]
MRTCSVVGCQSFKQGHKPHLFKVPVENKLEWTAIVQKLTNQKKELKYVCFEHFSPNDVKTTFSLPNDLGYSDDTLERQRYNLKKGVVPTIFKDLNLKPELLMSCIKESLPKVIIDNPESLAIGVLKKTGIDDIDREFENKQICLISPKQTINNTIYYDELLGIVKFMILSAFRMSYKTEKAVTLYLPKYQANLDKLELKIERQIVFNKNLNIDFYVNQKRIKPEHLELNNLEYPLNLNLILETIECFDSKKVCQGGPSVHSFPVLAQLVIKAICLLENAGASVDGVVSDGAATKGSRIYV